MNATQHEKLSKSRFEEKLLGLTSNLTKDKFYERSFDKDDNEQSTLLWLYYNHNGHVGTWHKGTCWVFEDNLNKGEK
jgi:hypothetical protein|tara:strand:- start:190 stop:420 length:231 start_codon:yes stop_codon:yes gene_type:complete